MKTYLNSLIIGLCVLLTAFIFSNTYKNRNQNNNTISVTGLGSKDFSSDLIVWSASFHKENNNLKLAYSSLDQDREIIKAYLIKKGVKAPEMVFSAIDISEEYENTYNSYGNITSQVFKGYKLTQTLKIESKKVAEIEQISREVSELINQGIELYSNQPEYYYTKLAQLKIEMIAQATKDANQRAQQIALNANSKVGSLKNATMGVFQIVAQNSSEEYGWGGSFNTSSKNKTANITVRLDYQTN